MNTSDVRNMSIMTTSMSIIMTMTTVQHIYIPTEI